MKFQLKKKLCVAILFGGQSEEHEVSLSSSISMVRFIDRNRYDIMLIGIDKHGHWMLCNEQDYLINPENLHTIQLRPNQYLLAIVPGRKESPLINANNGQPLPLINVAFPLLHGTSGEDGSIQGLFKILSIPCVGSNLLASAACMDKDIAKRILSNAGIPVIPSITLQKTKNELICFDSVVDQLGLPVFVKPARQGSSIGVSKVIDQTTFNQAIALAFRYDQKVIIEKAIIGREIEIAVLGNHDPKVSVCGEVFFKGEFYDYNAKYLQPNQVEFSVPTRLAASVENNMRNIASQAYLALGCSVMARIDFLIDKDNEIFLNEVNTIPGFTSTSIFPRLWEASGLSYTALIDRLISLTLLAH